MYRLWRAQRGENDGLPWRRDFRVCVPVQMKGFTPGAVHQESFGSSWFPIGLLGRFRLAHLENLLLATDAAGTRVSPLAK